MFVREEQKTLYDNLARRSAGLGDIYLGGLKILGDDTNPFRHQLAAHAFRELIDHLAKFAGAVVIKGESLSSRLLPVRRAFDALRDSSDPNRTLSRDPAVLSAALHEELNKLFDWQDNNQPQKRVRTAIVLTQLSGPGLALPSDVVTQEVSSWMRSQDYFNGVAHGGKRAEREEFLRSLYAVEDIVLRRVNPRPITDLDEIDALIQEGEDAN